MSNRYLERAEIEGRFAESANKHFGSHHSLVLSSGSFAYAGAVKGKSDLDVMTVFNDDIEDVEKMDLLEMIRGFASDYHTIHRDFGYKPDSAFPGEYITHANTEDAIAGRGFHTSSDSQLFLPTASTEFYQEDPENYFRAWRSMLAFSRRLSGDADQFQETKLRAWETIVQYLLTQFEEEQIDVDTILSILTSQEDKWQGVGVTNKCLTFSDEERLYIEQVLLRLKLQGILNQAEDRYEISRSKVMDWQSELADAIQSGDIRQSAFLLTQDDEEELTASTSNESAAVTISREQPLLETERYSASPMQNRYLGDCMQVVYSANENEQQENSLTDGNIIILCKTTVDPLQVASGTGKLFGPEHFEGSDVLLRISSACVHGSLGDTECDCHPDTTSALSTIGDNECGVFIYMPQDALGRGLRDKLRDHRLTYGVDRHGLPIAPLSSEQSMSAMYPEGYDIRSYHVLQSVLSDLGLNDIDFVFMGKNERKIQQVQTETGIRVASTMDWKRD
jgi:GTP cyclohydrolase II